MAITTKSLYTQVIEAIEKKTARISATTAKAITTSSNSGDVASLVNTASTDDVLSAMSSLLANVIEPRIISGLEVTQSDPVSTYVIVNAGTGTAGGNYYTLDEPVLLEIPLTSGLNVFYINLYSNGLRVEAAQTLRGLSIAKIILTNPAYVSYIYDEANGTDAYIQSFKKFNLYGLNERLEEDSIELLRDNIGVVLADNIIGNIRLNENLKISNVSGTIELDSSSLKLMDFDGNVMSKMTQKGVYFYDVNGTELAKFSSDGAHLGDIELTTTSIQSRNFVAGSSGFRIKNDGNAEFNDVIVRGTIYASLGQIGGWTIGANELYATTTGTIKTSSNVGAGTNGVILDKDGLRIYDAILGCVVNFPSDGSDPTISSGTIGGVTVNVDTNTVIRTSATVGDGSSSSAGILMNNTGIYGCGINQTLSDANFKVLADGNAYFKGEIQATSGYIGGISIVDNELVGGIIQGTTIIGALIENSEALPRIRIDADGIYYQVTTGVGKYGEFKYGDGTVYGTGILAYLFNPIYPVLSVVAEHSLADLRLFNRNADPIDGTHEIGDIICVNGEIKRCITTGTPGTFETIAGSKLQNLTSDPVAPVTGQMWIRTDL